MLTFAPLTQAQTSLPAQNPGARPVPGTYPSLCVTEGVLAQAPDGSLTVTGARMRAFVRLPLADAVQTRFTYLGPSSPESPLGSGDMRRQFGLKLRAADPCNLVYVMWRMTPESKLVVSVKSNPGQHTSTQCANRGYLNIKPRQSAPPPPLTPGQAHVLSAEIHGEALRASIDGRPVWEGDLGEVAAAMSGPVGVRSDNAHLAFTIAVGPGRALIPAQIPECRPGPDAFE
jgi:hypothetical protein